MMVEGVVEGSCLFHDSQEAERQKRGLGTRPLRETPYIQTADIVSSQWGDQCMR